MKVILPFLLLISLTSFTCSGKVIIRGKILDYDGKSLVYYNPIRWFGRGQLVVKVIRMYVYNFQEFPSDYL